MSYASATFDFFRDPNFFYGELLFEEGMIFLKQKSTQQGDFDDFLHTAQNRTGQWASKKGTNFIHVNLSNVVVACMNYKENIRFYFCKSRL